VNRINVISYTESCPNCGIGSGGPQLAGWFDANKARLFNEDKWWNGSNHVSVNTASEHDHQWLYRTAGGRWVLCQSSAWVDRQTICTFLDDRAALDWLLLNREDAAAAEFFGETPSEHGPKATPEEATSERKMQ
jgi:hypothetical protein